MKRILYIAHRAGGQGVLENRISTIRESLANKNVDAIEIDVRQTADHILVVQHDRGVYTNGRRIWIDKVQFEQIKHFDVPTLEEVFRFLGDSDKTLNIDIKDERCASYFIAFLKKHRPKNALLIDCFNIDALLQIQEEFPDSTYCLSQNPKDSFDFSRRFVFRIVTLLVTIFFTQLVIYFLKKKFRKVQIDGISIHAKFATRSFIRDLKAFGFKVFVYGVETRRELKRLSGEDVDGIKIENLSLLS